MEGEFSQVMAMFAEWRADIVAEPFPYTDDEILAEYRRRVDGRPAGHSPA